MEAQYAAMHPEHAAQPKPAPADGPAPAAEPKPAKAEGKGHAAPAYPAAISIEDFAKVRMQVGEVVASERVKKSEKLLKNTVKIGSETRTVVSGIAKFYSPEEMVGKKVVVVTNLKPAKLCGILSEGMILCAEDAAGDLSLLSPRKGDGERQRHLLIGLFAAARPAPRQNFFSPGGGELSRRGKIFLEKIAGLVSDRARTRV